MMPMQKIITGGIPMLMEIPDSEYFQICNMIVYCKAILIPG